MIAGHQEGRLKLRKRVRRSGDGGNDSGAFSLPTILPASDFEKSAVQAMVEKYKELGGSMRSFDLDYMPSIAEHDEILRAQSYSTPVHPGGAAPTFFIPKNDVETRFDPDRGELVVQCFRNPLPSEAALKYSMAAARKRAFVKRMVIMIEQSVLRDDINQMAWLTAKKFTRDIGRKTFGGQLAFTRQFLPQ
jgi:hypothetical protein